MTNADFRPDLQGLRALAIVLVILAHAHFDLFRGGFIGVQAGEQALSVGRRVCADLVVQLGFEACEFG